MSALARPPLVDVVVPVCNEEADLERSVRRLRRFLDRELPFPARVTIADDASTDGTWAVAKRLATELPGVAAMWLARKGRGRAQVAGRLVLGIALAITSASIAVLPLLVPHASRLAELAVLVIANVVVVATAVRFVVLRRFIGRPVPATLS